MVTPGAKREAVAHLCKTHQVSQRRACSVLSVDRSSVRYRSVRPNDADLRNAMKAVAAERRRFGYRRVHVMLGRQGWQVNQKKLRRLNWHYIAPGNPMQNALVERNIGPFRTEVINFLRLWKSVNQVEWEALKWGDMYNSERCTAPSHTSHHKRKRRHSSQI